MKKLPVVLVLENVRSLHNVGAIFRTADAAGVEEIILAGLTPTPPRSEIDKTALGATKTVPWHHIPHTQEYLQAIQAYQYSIYALEQTPSAQNFFTTSLSLPLVLIVGHEREGIAPELLQLAERHLFLPMHGHSAHSLNVSNAASIALYEISRRVWYDKEAMNSLHNSVPR